jgi:hypothetical protein
VRRTGFRKALAGNRNQEERTRLEQALTQNSRSWAGADDATAQCRSWAREAHSSALSDPERLAQLARESRLDCALFGHELEDEGGLPLAETRQARRAQGRTVR